MKNKTRYIPTGYKEYQPAIGSFPEDFKAYINDAATVVGSGTSQTVCAAMVFTGKKANPDSHYRFKTVEDAKQYIMAYYLRIKENKEYRAKRKEENKARASDEMVAVKVGDLFSYSWGYEQTNVDFYQVIEKKPKSFVMREIAAKTVSHETGNSMADEVSPVPGAFLKDAKPITKMSFSMPYGVLQKTLPTDKCYRSWYG